MNHECHFSLQQVYELSKNNNDIDFIANTLKVSTRILKRFIARFTFTNAAGNKYVLNFETLSRLNEPTPAHPYWETYTKINGGEIRNFAEMTFQKVHTIIQHSTTLDNCADALNIWSDTLYKWLTNLITPKKDLDHLNFDKLQVMTFPQ